MSTQIRFRLSGDEEHIFLQAALRAGLSPDAYARARALAPVDAGNAVSMGLTQRLATIEVTLAQLSKQLSGPSTHVKGMEANDLLHAIRDECVRGVNGFLRVVDADPLDSPTDNQATPDKSH